MSVKVEVWGEYACFTRPETKVERVSYDVMTPSAARGILDAIFYHPGLRWRIDRIYVLNPIQFTNVRRNEVKSKVPATALLTGMKGGAAKTWLSTPADIQQRSALVLRDVRYVIEAHFDMTERANASDNPGKFCDMARRRLERGQCYHRPYFGCREFAVQFRPWAGGEIRTAYPDEDRELGLMLLDMEYSDPKNITPMFFRAKLEKGVLQVADCEVLR